MHMHARTFFNFPPNISLPILITIFISYTQLSHIHNIMSTEVYIGIGVVVAIVAYFFFRNSNNGSNSRYKKDDDELSRAKSQSWRGSSGGAGIRNVDPVLRNRKK